MPMRMRLSGIVAIAVLAVTPGLSHGQVTLGPTLAYDNDLDFGIGATLGAPGPVNDNGTLYGIN